MIQTLFNVTSILLNRNREIKMIYFERLCLNLRRSILLPYMSCRNHLVSLKFNLVSKKPITKFGNLVLATVLGTTYFVESPRHSHKYTTIPLKLLHATMRNGTSEMFVILSILGNCWTGELFERFGTLSNTTKLSKNSANSSDHFVCISCDEISLLPDFLNFAAYSTLPKNHFFAPVVKRNER